VIRFSAAAAILAIVAGCNGSAGGSATPASGASASAPVATPVISSPPATGAADGTPLEVRDFTLEPLTLSVAGPDVELAVTNSGPTVHNVTIRDDAGTSLGGTRDLREGEADSLVVTLPDGRYVLFCSLPGHESLGIRGTLEVATP
jgi:plastocyanin